MEGLNGRFDDEDHYFGQAVDFLEKYRWLFQSPNTHILVHGILANIPGEWIACLRLSRKEEIDKAVAGQSHVTRYF